VRQLIEGGHDVTVFHRGETESPQTVEAEHVHGDFARLPEYLPRLTQRRPEVVVDVVPYISKDGHGVQHFRGIADRAAVVTSLDVYRAFAVAWGREGNAIEPMPLDEGSAIRSEPSPDLTPDIDFDNLEVEKALCDDPELPVTVLRLPIIYGANDPQRRLARYVRRMLDGREAIILDSKIARRRWSRGYVENVAAAIALAATSERGSGRTFNVAEEATPTEEEWIGSIADVLGWHGRVLTFDSARLPESMRSQLKAEQDIFVSSARLRDELGYVEPVALPEGLLRAVEWERSQEADEPRHDYATEDEVLGSLSD
jgi:hypothetical protein